MQRWIYLAALILWTGCAPVAPPKDYHAAEFKSDLKSRIDISVNYHLQPDSGIVVVGVGNPRARSLRLWLVQTTSTDGQRIVAARRFYQGADKKIQEIFKIPLPETGLKETFFVEAFDETGTLIITSEPINPNPIKEGTP